jgi:hypothetical protein
MRILKMILPRLELMVQLAGERAVVRDPFRLAELREDYRYMAAVCRTLLPELEAALTELPEPMTGPEPTLEARIAYQMALVRRTNRLHRAVEARVAVHESEQQARSASTG